MKFVLLPLFLSLWLRQACLALPAAYEASSKIRGVSLGGWFVLEPWITPSLFDDRYGTAESVDQWTWMQDAFDFASKGQPNRTEALAEVASYLQDHFSSFINETDINAIAAAGLNTIRIPLGHWTFDSVDWEPYNGDGIELPYVRKALAWAKKYNLDVHLDLHTAPNSQNGYENSGKQGPVQFSRVNATQNLDRVANSLRVMVDQFVCQSRNADVVKSILVLNEPSSKAMGQPYIASTYTALYQAVSGALDACATNSSMAQRPLISFHDAFVSPMSQWYDFFADPSFASGTIIVETHLYQAYAPQNTFTYEQHFAEVAKQGKTLSDAQARFPVHVGEFSLSVGTQYALQANKTQSGSAMQKTLGRLSTPRQNLFYRRYWETQVQTFESASSGWIFWTWKTEQSPDWSYQLGLQQGWIPADPTERVFRSTSSGGVSDKLIGAAPTFQTQTSSAGRHTPLLGSLIFTASLALALVL